MKKFYSLLGLFFFLLSFSYAQKGTVTGKITETGTMLPVSGALVQIKSLNLSVTTDLEGFFEMKNIQYGKYTVTITSSDFESYETPVEVNAEKVDLPPIQVKKKKPEPEGIAEVSTLTLDLGDENQTLVTSGLLHSTEDIFTATSGYIFGSMFFRTRGYDGENRSVLINGMDMSDAENGRTSFSDWGGLNDATRNKESYNCLASTPMSYSNVGGLTYINTRASAYRKQLKLSYSLTNRTYNDRVMLTYATGLLKSGWAVTLSGSRRWANEGYQQGTFYDGWSYFGSVEKKLNDKMSLALTAFGAPTKRGSAAATVQEAFDLAGSNFYNPNWGYQNGDKRNARVKYNHQPTFILSHFWNIDDKTKLNTTVDYTFGKNSWTSLNWYNAPDPRPDYYRYLPSWFSADSSGYTQELIRQQWATDPSVSQINWDHLYQTNYLSNGAGAQTTYILENNITKTSQFDFSTYLNKEVNPHITTSGGLNVRVYYADHYKVIEDMLGGDYWVDIDQYNQRDFPGDSASAQNDLYNPNKIIKQGDLFGYHYAVHQNNGNLWAQGNFTYNKIDFFVAGNLSGTQFWRTGYMKNGRHPNNSWGDSEKYNFLNFGLKGGITYKFTGRHFLEANIFYMTRAPFFTNTFVSPKTRSDVVGVADTVWALPGSTGPAYTVYNEGPQSEHVFGGDASLIVRYPWLNLRLTYFYTRFLNGTTITSFYHDDYQTYVNYVMKGIDRTHQGVEFGLEVKPYKFMSVVGVAAVGQYLYTSRPITTISFDNGSLPDTSALTYIENFYYSGTPQTALSLGLKFNYKYWFLDINGNYYDNNWLSFNPERRTEQAIAGLGPGDPLINTITAQQKLRGGFTLDASLGKSIRIKYKYFININLSVSNILNNKDIQSGGYEQNRFDFTNQDVSTFPPKYYYYYGTTYFLNINFRM
jgi:hypothetical protein